MLNITIPNNNVPERTYILDILLGEFLGLEFEVNISGEEKDWRIQTEIGKVVVIRDQFFSKHPKALSYLSKNNIPNDVLFIANPYALENDVPVLFGDGEFTVSSSEIIFANDIFAASFFMLTRWEEYVNKTRDKHERFPARESLAYKFGFLDRPIVNEYTEFLWALLQRLGTAQERKNRTFSVIPTHDVDSTYYWKNWHFILRTLIGDIVRRKSFKLFLTNFFINAKIFFSLRKDPFDTFDDLMDISESHGSKSNFFFMSGGNSRFDNAYSIFDLKTKKLIKHICARGHGIGIHPSYNSYNDKSMLSSELESLRDVADKNITYGRHHVLRYDVSATPVIWNDLGMEWDSTIGYAEYNGFRAGVCYAYSMFDFINRKILSLSQRPMIFMEVTDFKYRDLSIEESVEKTKYLLDKVRLYDGEFVCLWHNSNISEKLWRDKFDAIYIKSIMRQL